MNPVLVVMAKEPKVGSTKTRLCPPLSLEDAARLYEALLLDTLDLCSYLKNVDLAIAVTPPESMAYFQQIKPINASLLPVECENIGACLKKVIEEQLNMGYSKVLVLNSDGPTLPARYIYQAIELLDDFNLVLGPGIDGGYYLIGVTALHQTLFDNIDWSTPRVLQQSINRAKNASLTLALLPYWYDVDTVEDLHRLKGDIDQTSNERLVHTRKYLLESSSLQDNR